MSTTVIKNATLEDPKAPTLQEHLSIQRETGKVESAWISAGPETVVLVGLDGKEAQPGEPLSGVILTEGVLISSDKPATCLRGKNKLGTLWLAAYGEGQCLARKQQEEKGELPEDEAYPVIDAEEPIPSGDMLLTVTQAFTLGRDLTHKYKTGGLKALDVAKGGARLLLLQKKAGKLMRQAQKDKARRLQSKPA